MIGLSLSGGGIKGSYEIGAYMAFKKCHIKFDGFVGCSIGSFNAAMLACGRDKELLDYWRNVDLAKLIDMEDTKLNNFKKIIANKGVSTKGLKEELKSFNIEDDLRKSNKDYGLITVRFKDLKPLYLFKEDIKRGQLNDYIMGSCYFPGFKQEKMLDNSYYLDGGFFDNSPVNMLIDKGYDKVYEIDLKAIGFKQKIKDKNKVITIKPSRPLGAVFMFDKERINYNIKLGYYDTIKVLKNLDGHRYIFKRVPSWYYKRSLRNVSTKMLNKLKKYFKTEDEKELVIKAVEYVMRHEKCEYTCIYKPFKEIKRINKSTSNTIGVWGFLKSIKTL